MRSIFFSLSLGLSAMASAVAAPTIPPPETTTSYKDDAAEATGRTGKRIKGDPTRRTEAEHKGKAIV